MQFLELAVSISCSDSSPVLTDVLFFSTRLKTGYQVPAKWLVPTCCRKTSCILGLEWYLSFLLLAVLGKRGLEAVAPGCMSGAVTASDLPLSRCWQRGDGECAARLVMKGDLCTTDMTKGKIFLVLKCSQVNKRRANCRRKEENLVSLGLVLVWSRNWNKTILGGGNRVCMNGFSLLKDRNVNLD